MSTMTGTARALTVSPLFLVSDVVQAGEYYRDKLGFRILRYHGEPPCFCMVQRDFVEVLLKRAEVSEGVRPNGIHDAWDAYFWTDDLDGMLAEFTARGTKIVSEPRSTFYGTREIEVEDASGYRLCFAQDTSRAP